MSTSRAADAAMVAERRVPGARLHPTATSQHRAMYLEHGSWTARGIEPGIAVVAGIEGRAANGAKEGDGNSRSLKARGRELV